MKKISILVLLTCLCLSSFSIVDTLRHYNPGSSNSNAPSGYDLYVGRFELPAPGYLQEIMITLSGLSTDGTVKLHVFGHEGGTSFPQLQHDLVLPITLQKSQFGTEQIYVQLPDPIWLDNNQFFIAISDIEPGVRLISTSEPPESSCSSSSGGDYYYQFIYGNGSWYLGSKKSFKIDAIIDYPDLTSGILFQDVTNSSGINSSLSNKSIATVDYDEDGYVDIMVSGRLYRNNGAGQFIEKTQQVGLRGNPAANTFLDMDNDNDLDILFLDSNDSSFVYINNGSGIFIENFISSLPVFKSIHGFSITDVNSDNFPDLFVCQLWATYPEPELNYLFFNDTANGFIDTTKTIYPEYNGVYNYPNAAWNPPFYVYEKNRNSRGCSWVDFDNDSDPDLFVTNYFLQQDEFYQNNGDGTFTDICVLKGIDHNPNGGSNHGTGTDWYDYDNDGDFDLLLPQFAHPSYLVAYDHRGTTIYRNDGPPGYSFFDTHGSSSDADGDQGIQFEETHAGACWGDFNNDGLADFYISTYYGCRFVDVYIQNADHSFSLKTFDYGIQNIVSGNDAVCFDYNRDGRLDLAAGNGNHIRIFENKDIEAGNSIFVKVQATSSNKFAIGAKVKLFVDGQVLTQEVNAGRGQKMQRPFTLHFGLGNNIQIDSAQVVWPGQSVPESFFGLIANNTNVLTEGGAIDFLGNSIDAAIISFAQGTGCGFSSSEIITIQVANFGYETISSYQLSYWLNGDTISPETCLIPIAPGNVTDYTFTTPADCSGQGSQNISAKIYCMNDSNSFNDQLSYYQITNTPALDLGSDKFSCPGEFVDFQVSANFDVAAYFWSNGSIFNHISVSSEGLYFITVTDMCGNAIVDSVNLFHFVVPQVDLGPDIYFNQGDTVELDAGNWETYLWSTGETTQSIQVSEAGTYTVSITDQNGCSNHDEINVQLYLNSVSINAADLIKIHPNPTNGLFFIDSEFKTQDKIDIRIYDILGIELCVVEEHNFPIQIDLSTRAKGVYIIQVETTNIHLKHSVIVR